MTFDLSEGSDTKVMHLQGREPGDEARNIAWWENYDRGQRFHRFN